MTRELLNTLYVLTPGAYVRVDHETVKVELEKKVIVQVPVQHLGAIVLCGRCGISTEAICRCVRDGRSVVILEENGRFRARVVGPTRGNVMLRKEQYDAHADPDRTGNIARMFVAGKIRNGRSTMLRAARDTRDADTGSRLREQAQKMADMLAALETASNIDVIRGLEGQASAAYFGGFSGMITVSADDFEFRTRTRRPPRDRVNALLSFTYSLLTNDCTAALEGVGLDPGFGYLHVLRPGRPSLALDLVEEFRSWFADRLVLTLINRRQIRPEHFQDRDGGSVALTQEGRKVLLTAYQKRKQEEVSHPLLVEAAPVGLIPHLQARLLARHLRKELEEYPPYVAR